MDYRVQLDVFNGPLDLLLFLIKRDELDIYDIPIARITDSYIQYVRHLKEMSKEHGLDINVAGDFMVMAATLMEIKSATLLPKQEVVSKDPNGASLEQLTDPRYELVKQLLEYKKLKDQSTLLERQRAEHEARFPRIAVLPDFDTNEPPPLDMDEVQVWDLLDAFSKVMRDIGFRRPKFHEVEYDETPIELHAADIEDRLKREKKLSLRALLVGRTSRSDMIGVFLALLELIREKKILAHQNEVGDDIEIEDAPPEHKKLYAHASMHLAVDAPAEVAEVESAPTDESDDAVEAAERT